MILSLEPEDARYEHPSKHTPLDSPTSPLLDPPPEYTFATTTSSVAGVGSSNYVSIIHRLGSLEGSWVIDPTLPVPRALLPVLPKGHLEDSRKHLHLEAKAGSIHADVSLIDKPLMPSLTRKSGRVMMAARTHATGNIVLNLHALNSEIRTRFHLTAQARSGSITICIPRSFYGSLVLSVPLGFISLSKSLSSTLTTISEVRHTRRCFVGDISRWQVNNPDDEGAIDELFAETKVGSITVLYDDELVGSAGGIRHGHRSVLDADNLVRMNAGLFGRVFGRWGPGTPQKASTI